MLKVEWRWVTSTPRHPRFTEIACQKPSPNFLKYDRPTRRITRVDPVISMSQCLFCGNPTVNMDDQSQDEGCLAKKVGHRHICTVCLQELNDALEWKRRAD